MNHSIYSLTLSAFIGPHLLYPWIDWIIQYLIDISEKVELLYQPNISIIDIVCNLKEYGMDNETKSGWLQDL